jgi:CheY-like chemotaxis protein
MTKHAPRILLVEDDNDHAELVLRALGEHGIAHDVTHVQDGASAVEYLFGGGESPRPRPDVIFLDLRLPKVDGLEVLRRIKSSESLKDVPVVVLTTSDADRDLASAYDSHVNAYVVKPVDFDSLDRMIRETSAFWLAWNRQPA